MTINLQTIDQVIAAGPFVDIWESLSQVKTPQWFPDAKFGIFTHWGLYTVPEYRNEWYSRNMYIEGYPEFDHHVKTYGPQKTFGYKDFIPLFTAKSFNADEWLDLFKASGARYYFPVSEHHDGFQMYNSELSHWNTVEMGPHRDILGELRESTLRHGLHFATSNHRAEHWWFMGHGKEFDSDVTEPLHRGDFYWPAAPEPDNQDLFSNPWPSEEYLDDWLLRVCEIIDNYQPELLYFDWWIQHEAFKPYIRKLAAFYYNRGAQWNVPVSICYKDDGMAWGSGLLDVERGGFTQPKPYIWQTDTSIARNSWCYTDSLEYKSLSELIITLIDTVSKNGNLLLNVGPRADGSIADHDRTLLNGIGEWLRINGEGIYGSRPWKLAQEGPTSGMEGSFADQQKTAWTSHDFRFTAKNGDIYAFCLSPRDAREVNITSFAGYHDGKVAPFHGVVRAVEQLGYGQVAWERNPDGMHITLAQSTTNAGSDVGGKHASDDSLPVSFKISIE
jgi:alpha-L-fucosidase